LAPHAVVWNGTTAADRGTLGGTSSWAYAINDAGQVAGGAYFPGDADGHAIQWNGSTPTDLGTLKGVSVALAINDAGQVAGYSFVNPGGYGSGPWHATLWNGTTPTDLDMGGNLSEAHAINNAGQVAGWQNYHAVVWNGTTVTPLGTSGVFSVAEAINDSGMGAGYSEASGARHATLWDGTAETDLGTLGGGSSEAFAINDSGQVTGWAATTDGAQHAALWNGTTATDLNIFLDASTVNAGWVLTVANGINDHGWIVGDAHNSKSGVTHAFLLAPIPEPETYAMLLAGLGLVSFMARRRKSVCITYTLHS
jgi:probable HAF family extracellular repeat protein